MVIASGNIGGKEVQSIARDYDSVGWRDDEDQT